MIYWGATAPLFYEEDSTFSCHPLQYLNRGNFDYYRCDAQQLSSSHG